MTETLCSKCQKARVCIVLRSFKAFVEQTFGKGTESPISPNHLAVICDALLFFKKTDDEPVSVHEGGTHYEARIIEEVKP